MKRIIRTLVFGGLMWCCAAPIWADSALHHANTHFLMQDLNNNVLADLFAQWLSKNHLNGK